MIKVYELNKVPQLGEVLTCKCYKEGDSIPCILIHAKFADQSDPIQVIFERTLEVSFGVCLLELRAFYTFIDSPHWRNSVARQWKRYGDLFDDDVSFVRDNLDALSSSDNPS